MAIVEYKTFFKKCLIFVLSPMITATTRKYFIYFTDFKILFKYVKTFPKFFYQVKHNLTLIITFISFLNYLLLLVKPTP